MPRVTFPSKEVSEDYQLNFNFISYLDTGDTISSAVVASSLYSGVDPSPGNVIPGGATISGTYVLATAQNGVNGCIYEVSATATCASGLVIKLIGFLAVVQTLV